MAQPSTAITRFDLSLSYQEFSLRANQRRFIGLKVLPPIAVALQNAEFMRVKVASLMGPVEKTERAPKGTYARGSYEWGKDSYATQDHGVEEVLDDRSISIYGNEVKAERIHRDRAINRVLQAFEDDISKAVFNTTTWSGAALTSAAATAWTTPATATPISDIDGAIEKVEAGTGKTPNSMVISNFALRKLARTAQIQDLTKHSGHDDPKDTSNIVNILRGLFEFENIFVGSGFKNTNDEGQDASFARGWDKTMCMVCNILASDDLEDPEPTIGRVPMWNEDNAQIPGIDNDGTPDLIMEEYREEDRRGGIIRARMDRQVKIFHKEVGHLLTGVTA